MDPREASAGEGLFPEEAAMVASAVQSRRQQFTAGRCLARQAWQQLGHPPAPLLSDQQRVPAWPTGIVGTITHTHVWCAAAVAERRDVSGLGADVEPATALEPALWERVCRPEEREFLLRQTGERGGLLAKGVFSAKESIYKALYPSIRVFLDFQAMRIELEPTAILGTWTWYAELQVPWGHLAAGQRLGPGKLGIDRDLILTAVVL
jgi:4'-phosphopantetheinyl transferase EntD